MELTAGEVAPGGRAQGDSEGGPGGGYDGGAGWGSCPPCGALNEPISSIDPGIDWMGGTLQAGLPGVPRDRSPALSSLGPVLSHCHLLYLSFCFLPGRMICSPTLSTCLLTEGAPFCHTPPFPRLALCFLFSLTTNWPRAGTMGMPGGLVRGTRMQDAQEGARKMTGLRKSVS